MKNKSLQNPFKAKALKQFKQLLFIKFGLELFGL